MNSYKLKPGIDMIYRLSPDGQYRYMNKRAAEFLGATATDVIGRHFLDFVRQDFHQPTLKFYEQQIAQKQASTYFEFPVVSIDGTERWVGQSIELVCEGDEVVELLGVARDISDQLQTKQKLKNSDIQFATLIANINAAILVEDAERKLKFANQQFCDYFGIPVPPEDLVGMDCAQAAEQSKELFLDPEAFLEGIALDLKNKINHSGVRLHLKDERVFERDYVPIYLNSEVYGGHMWLYRDVTMRSLSEQAIKESEKKYREAMENIDLGLMEVDNEEKILSANEPFLKATGYQIKEILGKDAKEVFLNEEDRKYHAEALKRNAEMRLENESSVYELPVRAKSGERLWFMISGTPIKNFQGEVVGSLGIHHNVSDLKKLQGELEYRNHLQDILLDLSSELIGLKEESQSEVINKTLANIGSFVGADRAYIFDYFLNEGYTSNTYEWCAERISPEIENLQEVPLEAIPLWSETHKKGEAMIYEDVSALEKEDPIREILEPQGIQSIITVPIMGETGLSGFIGFDAVNHKKKWSKTEVELLSFMAKLLQAHGDNARAEKRLVQSELTQRTILDSALDAMIIIDSSNNVRFWNKQAETIFGHSVDQVLGKSLDQFIIPEKFREAHKKGMAHFMKTGEGPVLGKRIELISIHKEGYTFPIEFGIIPIEIDGDTLFAAFLRDITARKKAEDDINEALEQQKELARMKSRLISMASHEFRTPLTTIKANAEMLEIWAERLPENQGEKAQKYFNRLNREIERLSNIMTDILIMGRLESGRIKMKPRNIDLYSLVMEYIDRHHSERKDGRKLEVVLKGAPKILSIDPDLFDHIFNNLVGNAFKYSEGAKNPIVTLRYQEDKLRLAIQDFGIGIPEEDQPKIFASFFRSENTKGIVGSGMGLAVVKQMADMHNINIKVFSAENEGTEFILEIPYPDSNGGT